VAALALTIPLYLLCDFSCVLPLTQHPTEPRGRTAPNPAPILPELPANVLDRWRNSAFAAATIASIPAVSD